MANSGDGAVTVWCGCGRSTASLARAGDKHRCASCGHTIELQAAPEFSTVGAILRYTGPRAPEFAP